MTPSENHYLKIGKMAFWHKCITYLTITLTVSSGVVWFIHEDVFGLSIDNFRLWINLHGVIGHLLLIVLGMAFYHHVQICIRMKKNILMGTLFILASLFLIASILALYYGQGVIHEQAHLMHLISGTLFSFLFVLHIHIGRKSLVHYQKKKELIDLNGVRV
jgi:hypothetical protein